MKNRPQEQSAQPRAIARAAEQTEAQLIAMVRETWDVVMSASDAEIGQITDKLDRAKTSSERVGFPMPRVMRPAAASATFEPGDTIRVSHLEHDGDRMVVCQTVGVCIKREQGSAPRVTIRLVSYGEGVERIFPLNSRTVRSIEVIRKGAVRRAKMHYLRGRSKRTRDKEQSEDRPDAAQEA